MLHDQGKQTTLVTFLLDRTGSMDAIKTETIGGFNAYLDTLERKAGDLVEFTLLQFDSVSIDKLRVGAKLADVERLTPDTYQPRAYTPLIDACYEAIKVTEELVARRRDKPCVFVVFQTDGAENASREHNLDELRDLIARRKAEDWEFVFLGADIDAYEVAQGMGLLREETLSYAGSRSLGTLREVANIFSDVAQGRARRVRFSDEQKRAAGDRFDLEAVANGDALNERPAHKSQNSASPVRPLPPQARQWRAGPTIQPRLCAPRFVAFLEVVVERLDQQVVGGPLVIEG